MPLPFYLCCLAILVMGNWAWSARWESWGLPVCMVLGAVSVWYVGDVFYNDYESYQTIIGTDSLTSAWWQVLLFLLSFAALVVPVHRWMNDRLLGQQSHVIAFAETNRLQNKDVQYQIDLVGGGLLAAWLVLMAIGLIRVKGNFIGLFAPYLGQKMDPWGRGQIGGGFSAMISFASYMQLFMTAAFGVLAALAMNPRTRTVAITVCCLALPFYIFDRTRNAMLAAVLPGVLAFVFLRLRCGLAGKVTVLGAAFLIINFWFGIVMANRSGNFFDIEGALSGGEKAKSARHEGLNMFEELALIDQFIMTEQYLPNWGARYFAEIVNPIPRGLWKNKPMIGLDYALARGQQAVGAKGEMTATISTGMIGQGVVNFGRFFGPMAAALLMALWVATLARQDLNGKDPGRLILYGCGLVLTFNLGRDITLLVLYPFFFGLGLLWIMRRFGTRDEMVEASGRTRLSRKPASHER